MFSPLARGVVKSIWKVFAMVFVPPSVYRLVKSKRSLVVVKMLLLSVTEGCESKR